MAWGAGLLMGAPLLFTCIVQGLGMFLAERGVISEEGLVIELGLWVVFAGYALSGVGAAVLLLYGATVAVWWRRVLALMGVLSAVPLAGVLLAVAGVDIYGAGVVGVVWRLSVVLLVGMPLGAFVTAGLAAFLWGYLSAVEEPASLG